MYLYRQVEQNQLLIIQLRNDDQWTFFKAYETLLTIREVLSDLKDGAE